MGWRSTNQVVTDEWVTFPGGELEGKRPKALCAACREALKREAATYGASGSARRSRLLCFDCYRADLARARALKAAGELDTASEARFQTQLPFEPVNHARLDALKADARRGARGREPGASVSTPTSGVTRRFRRATRCRRSPRASRRVS